MIHKHSFRTLNYSALMDATEIFDGADKILKVSSRLTFLDGFLGVLTQGIYTPRTATVECKI